MNRTTETEIDNYNKHVDEYNEKIDKEQHLYKRNIICMTVIQIIITSVIIYTILQINKC